MAELETTIPLSDGSDSSSVTVGLESPSTNEQPVASPAEDAVALQAKIADLTRQADQYKRERQGWEIQSRRNLDERNVLAERLARIEEHLQATQQGTPRVEEPRYSPGQLKKALKSWLDGQDTDLDMVEQALARSTIATQQPIQAAPDPTEYKRLIREELMELGQRSTVQSIVGQNHPDMTNPQSALSRAVWDAYDAFAAAPATQFLYTKDPRFEVAMIGPDGGQRMVDARMVDRLAADIRLKAGVQEGRRLEGRAAQMGGVTSSTNGRPLRRNVEAIELLTPGELALIQDPKVRKGWPKMPSDPKAAAKYFYDNLSTTEKAKRVAEHQGRRGTVV